MAVHVRASGNFQRSGWCLVPAAGNWHCIWFPSLWEQQNKTKITHTRQGANYEKTDYSSSIHFGWSTDNNERHKYREAFSSSTLPKNNKRAPTTYSMNLNFQWVVLNAHTWSIVWMNELCGIVELEVGDIKSKCDIWITNWKRSPLEPQERIYPQIGRQAARQPARIGVIIVLTAISFSFSEIIT